VDECKGPSRCAINKFSWMPLEYMYKHNAIGDQMFSKLWQHSRCCT